MIAEIGQTEILVDVLRIRPAGEPGHDVELSEQAAHHHVRVLLDGEMVELRKNAAEGFFGFGDGAARVVLALLLKTTLVLHEFFPVELGQYPRSRGPAPRLG